MSVQAGIWNFGGAPADPGLLRDLTDSLKQQGPDGTSSYVNANVAMLYRPFHTTAESRRETQPRLSRRGFVLTWDGRLDNREELIAEFRSYLDPDSPDVDIVAAAFDHWETDCFPHIVGDWAVSIWRPMERELVFGADHMAIRHIFYYLKRDRIWWSTDLTALVLLSGDSFHIDDDYIAGYFAHDPDAHRTPYREIREVPPGHFVCVCNDSTHIERYWRFNPKSRIRYKTDAEYEEHFRQVFRQSIRRRLRSDAPILAELSGGLDSSSIVCMADDILAKEGAQTARVDTLSYYDKTEPHGDDWIYFQKVEAHRGRTGHHIDASKLGTDPAPLEPTAFNSLPGYLGSGRNLEAERAIVVRAGGYRVVLSGEGGDEFTGGNPVPYGLLADLIMQCKFITLVRQLTAWSLVKRRPWIQLLGQTLFSSLPPALAQYVARQAKIEPWIERNFAKRTGIRVKLLDVDEHFGFWLPTRRSYIGTLLLMANKMAKVKSPSEALEEYRYPYLDRDFLDFVLSIPADQLLRPGERRSLMRRSLSGIVPHEILSRPTKQVGSRTPIISLQNNLRELERLLLASSLGSRLGYINNTVLVSKIHAALNGETVHLVRLFRAVSLELWLRDLVLRRLIDVGSASPASTESTLAVVGA